MLKANSAKNEAAAPISLFYIIFVSRLLIGFTASSSVLGTKYTADLAVSTAIAVAGALAVTALALIMFSRHKNVLDNPVLRPLYGAFYIFSGALSIVKFALFSSAELHQEARTFVLAAFMLAASTYAAALGIESLCRFSALVFALAVIGTFGIVASSFGKFETINLFPFMQNGFGAMLSNAAYSLCSTSEIPLLFALRPKINGKIGKPFCFAIGLSYLLSLLLALVACGVLGDTASVSSYPLFELSQLAQLGTGERVEVVFTALWIFAMFLKISVFLYCSSLCFGKNENRKKCLICGLAMLGFTALILYTRLYLLVNDWLVYIPFGIFGIAVPAGYLLLGKKESLFEGH